MGYERKAITDEDTFKTLRISPSSLNVFRQCPRKWFYEYVLAEETVPAVALSKGSAVHKVLEDIFDATYVPSGEAFREFLNERAIELFERIWETEFKDKKFDSSDVEAAKKSAKRIIISFVNRFVDNIQEGIQQKHFSNESMGFRFNKPKFREMWVDDEKKIDLKNRYQKKEDKEDMENPLHVGGFIDSITKDFDNNYTLIDYKTSKRYGKIVPEDYMIQLAIYAYLWQRQTGKMPHMVGVDYLQYNREIYIMVTPSLIQMAIGHIKHMRSCITDWKLDKSQYPGKESKLCNWCSFQKECREYEEKLKVEDGKKEDNVLC